MASSLLARVPRDDDGRREVIELAPKCLPISSKVEWRRVRTLGFTLCAWYWHKRSMGGWLAPTARTYATIECIALLATLTGEAKFTAAAIWLTDADCATAASLRHIVWIERMSSIPWRTWLEFWSWFFHSEMRLWVSGGHISERAIHL